MKKMLFILFLLIIPLSSTFATSQPVRAKHGIAVSEQRLASQVGIDILRAGGNAIDAAVAMGYALAVVSPCCGNIGGGGFMLIHLANGKNIFLNFREKAPLAAKEDMFLDANKNIIHGQTTLGYLAIGVPGTVLGLDTALKKYGTMTRQQVLAPAIRLASKGFILTEYEAKLLADSSDLFRKQPNVAAIFLKNNQPFQAGDRLVQTKLAHTLKLIAEKGPSVFYRGEIAQAIVEASQAHGGILKMNDFSQYTVENLSPIQCTYHDYSIISSPPPSSGGVALCEMMNILENYPLSALGYHSALSVHYIVEAMRYAFFDRNNKLGDPDFIKNPIATLISKKYARTLAKKIRDHQVIPSPPLDKNIAEHESLNTTHYSVVDKNGNAVSVTYTLNGYFGAKVIAGNSGFFLNNEMDDFTVQPGSPNQFGLTQGNANSIQPGKRPLSSMAPTIVIKKGCLYLVLGSPGGPRIITAILQTLLNVMDYHKNIQEAVDAPRFHHQWQPDLIDTEPFTFSNDTQKKLQQMGYHFMLRDKKWGAVEAIMIDPVNGTLLGGSDNRRPAGKAVGYE